MALTCPASLGNVDLGFTEFLDCATLNINYDKLGIATLTFTVISVNADPKPSLYTELEFGGITFTTFVTGIELRKLPGTLVFEHKYNLTGKGCR